MGRVDGLIIPRSYNDYFSRSDPQAIRAIVAQYTDAALSSTSKNPVQNKVVKAALDGKQATLTFDDAPTENSNNPVKSGGVFTELDKLKQYLAPPTDAVLHYSFDELPDYPDGTASVRLINNNTYDMQSGSFALSAYDGGELSNDNGNIKCVKTGTSYGGLIYSNSAITGKIVKIKIRVTDNSSVVRVSTTTGGSQIVSSIATTGILEATFVADSMFAIMSPGGTFTAIIEQIYIGDGSYSTPVINNANGENNGTNNGGIATKGVSGKGVRFLGDRVVTSNENIGEINKSFSCWFSIDNIVPARCIFCKNYNNGFIVLARNVNNVNTLAIFYYSAGYTNIAQLTANTIYHLVVICGTANIKVYLNGILVTTINVTVVDNINRLFIGALTSSGSNGFYGMIDDFQVFDRALTDTEVQALYLNKANTSKYYSLADYKLAQLESAQTRGGTTEETPNERKSNDEPPEEETKK